MISGRPEGYSTHCAPVSGKSVTSTGSVDDTVEVSSSISSKCVSPASSPNSRVTLNPMGPPYDRSSLYGRALYGRALYGRALYGRALYGRALHGRALYGRALYGRALYGRALYGRAL